MSDALLVLISIVAALVIVGAFLATVLFLAAWISSEWILDLYQTYGITRRNALRLILGTFFHTLYPSYTVENGEIADSRPEGLLPILGGPGRVIIKPYNAVVFEQGGNTTRIEGPGLVLTRRFETHKAIIDLRKQSIRWKTDRLLTKDHVPLTFQCSVGFRIESAEDTAKHVTLPIKAHEGGRFPGTISGDYTVDQHTLYRAVYGTTEAGWKLTTKGATEGQLANVVREHLLTDLCILSAGRPTLVQSKIDAIVAETLKRVQAISHTWGVTVTSFKIVNFEAPEDIQEQLAEMWAADYAREKLKIVSGGEADALLSKSKAEAQALAQFEQVHSQVRQAVVDQIRQGLDYGLIVSDAVAQRFISAVEQISKNLVSDRVNATRYVEMLERIAESEGTKTLIVGDSASLRGPGRGKGDDAL